MKGTLSLVDRIDALLPQTQCTRCGHAGCRPYAEAIAQATADINRCPPGGETTVNAIAALLRRPPLPLDPACGEPGPLVVARIDESACIGCTLCIAACPIDAIIGAEKRMHAVLASLCSGCGLCAPPCPVDCIAMLPAGREWSDRDRDGARERFEQRQARRARGRQEVAETAGAKARRANEDGAAVRRAAIAAAVARARERRALHGKI